MLSGRRHKDVSKFEALRSFLMVVAFILVAVPIVYGFITILLSLLWPSGASALVVPYAPESIGVMFLILGVVTGACALRPRWSRLYSILLRAQCFFWSVLNVSFIVDAVTDVGGRAATQILSATVMSILCAAVANLEDAWRD